MNRNLLFILSLSLVLSGCFGGSGGSSTGGGSGGGGNVVDTDGDGIADNVDTDDDNDGVIDSEDAFPLNSAEFRDTDNDGIGDNADTDDDNDGVEDADDAFPLDASETTDNDQDGIGDNADTDDDNDGVEDSEDDLPNDPDETLDTDGDGVGNNTDTDDDNDGVEDTLDIFPLDPSEQIDTDEDGIGNNADPDDDNDGVADSDDAFPLDKTESTDTDGDGIGNNADTDDDNDGVLDVNDAFPLDSTESADNDGDGIGNNADADDDNDGVADHEDAFPFDASESVDTDGDGIGNNADSDDDNDGVSDANDAFPLDATESVDTDGDGIGNNADTDDDNDGVADSDDAFPLDSTETTDTDGDGKGNNADRDDDNDGTLDSEDDFPLDSSESTDTDGDGIGNNADTDDDNDGVADADDAFPLDKNETTDTDGDGTGNNADTDDDNDGVADADDAFPLDKNESIDTDGDGTGNNADTDDDNDGVQDSDDAFPLDAAETLDSDGDGIGNNADTDDDNDGVADADDAFPLDATETTDTDGDGIGNNADTDDDNDGVADSDDAFPLDATETTDTDGDGIGNNADTDDDNDGVADSDDALPLDATESMDTDGDGIGNNADTDDDNDGVSDSEDAFPLDASESEDTDRDGIGNNADTDDDNDGIADSDDQYPTDSTNGGDTDLDGTPNYLDDDDDNDGVKDTDDYFPLDFACWEESHGNSNGTCDFGRLVEEADDIVVAESEQNVVFIFDQKQQMLHRWDIETAEYIAPIQLQTSSGLVANRAARSATSSTPTFVTAIFATQQQRLYLQDDNHLVVYIDLSDGTQHNYVQRSEASESISTFGDYVQFNSVAGSESEPDYSAEVYDAQGQKLSDINWGSSRNFAFDKAKSRFYHVQAGQLRIIDFDKRDGSLYSNSEEFYGFNALSANDGVTLSADGNTLVTLSGLVINTAFRMTPVAHIPAHSEIKWLGDDTVVTLHQVTRNGQTSTRLQRFDADFQLLETRFVAGEPRGVFAKGGDMVVLAESDKGRPVIQLNTPSSDSDGDGVDNANDAFPDDVAASVDADGDGYPDSWNENYSQSDSTSGLILDAYAGHSACYLPEHGNQGVCDPASTQGDFDLSHGHTFVHNEQTLYTLDSSDSKLVTINALNGKLEDPVFVGRIDQAMGLNPSRVHYAPTQGRVYLAYPNEVISYIDLNGQSKVEQFFVKAPASGLTIDHIQEAGNYLTVQYAAPGSSVREAEHYTYGQDGQLIETLTSVNPHASGWDAANERIVYVETPYESDASFQMMYVSYHYLSQHTGVTTQVDRNVESTGFGRGGVGGISWSVLLFDNNTKFATTYQAQIYEIENVRYVTALDGDPGHAADYADNVLFTKYGSHLSVYGNENIDYRRSAEVCSSGDQFNYIYGAQGRAYALTQHNRTKVIRLMALGLDPLPDERTCYTTLNNWVDTDGDGIGNTVDLDDDGDGYNDDEDAFPLDASEWLDTDNDGIGNNADTDDDNDGILDVDDDYPLDPLNLPDADGDGVADVNDVFPNSGDCYLTEHADSNGVCDPAKTFEYVDMTFSATENRQIFDDGNGIAHIVQPNKRKIVRLSGEQGKLLESILFGRLKEIRSEQVSGYYPAFSQGRIYLQYANNTVTYLDLNDNNQEKLFVTDTPDGWGQFKGLTVAGDYVSLRYQQAGGDDTVMRFVTYNLAGEQVADRQGLAVTQGYWDEASNKLLYVGFKDSETSSINATLYYLNHPVGAGTGEENINQALNEIDVDNRKLYVEFVGRGLQFSMPYGDGVFDPETGQFNGSTLPFIGNVEGTDNYLAGVSNTSQIRLLSWQDYSEQKRFYSCQSGVRVKYLWHKGDQLYTLLDNENEDSLTLMAIDTADLQGPYCLTFFGSEIDLNADSDNDGVIDSEDDYPLDPDAQQRNFSLSGSTTLLHKEQTIYTLDSDGYKLVVIDALNGQLQSPVRLGKLGETSGIKPKGLHYVQSQQRIYLNYDNGVITHVDLQQESKVERLFVAAPSAGLLVQGMHDAGDYLVVQYAASGESTTVTELQTFNADGELIETRNNVAPYTAQWDEDNGRVVYMDVTYETGDRHMWLNASYHYIDQSTGQVTQSDKHVTTANLSALGESIYLFDGLSKYAGSTHGEIFDIDPRTHVATIDDSIKGAKDYQDDVLFNMSDNQLAVYARSDLTLRRSAEVCNQDDSVRFMYGADGKAFALTQNDSSKAIVLMSLGLAPLANERSCYTIMSNGSGSSE